MYEMMTLRGIERATMNKMMTTRGKVGQQCIRR